MVRCSLGSDSFPPCSLSFGEFRGILHAKTNLVMEIVKKLEIRVLKLKSEKGKSDEFGRN